MAGKKRGKIEGETKFHQIGFPPKLYGFLEEEAKKKGVSIPHLVRDIVDEHFHGGRISPHALSDLPLNILLEEIERRVDHANRLNAKAKPAVIIERGGDTKAG